MSKKKVSPKTAQKKTPVPPPSPGVEHDPAYIGLRMRGLARLVFHASNDSDNADPIDQEAAFFISTQMEQWAVALGAR